MKAIIRSEIEKASKANPVTSTRLREIVRKATGQSISARSVRFVVDELRKGEKLPILATRSGQQGYYLCRSKKEFEGYEAEMRRHALRELTTLSEIKSAYFGQIQSELIFV